MLTIGQRVHRLMREAEGTGKRLWQHVQNEMYLLFPAHQCLPRCFFTHHLPAMIVSTPCCPRKISLMKLKMPYRKICSHAIRRMRG